MSYYTSTAHWDHYHSNTTFSEACVILIWKSPMLWRNSDFPWVKQSNICIWLFTSTTAFDLNGSDSGIYCIFSSQLKYHADSPSKIKINFSLPPPHLYMVNSQLIVMATGRIMQWLLLFCQWRGSVCGTMIICNGTADSEPFGYHCALN